ncbi:hypothetical protein [Anaerotignum lactatifermentans]|uniref:hypothetical protein n=1 Tax=Anaerotignum lactatifermentans TaxID=160404 RepID=UPI00242AB78E|nr:hypothetical protein [Anaerotignum lactatifermentans]
MKSWGKHFYFLLAVLCALGLSGCDHSITITIDGAEIATTELEEKHWISVEELQDYGFALQKGDKMTGSLETNWVLYPLSPAMKTVEKEEIVVHDEAEKHHVYCNGLLVPTKVINGELMVAVESLTGENLDQSYMTYSGIWENMEQLQQTRFSVYLVEKKEEAEDNWDLYPLRPTMPLRTPWGCILFEKVLTDDIPFTKESFAEEYVSLPELAENMDLSFALHKGILHMHQDGAVENYQVPLETVSQDFMEQRLISGYALTGEGIRIACVYDGKKLYANLEDMKEVVAAEGYAYDEETRTFTQKN